MSEEIIEPCPWCQNEGIELEHPDGASSYWVACLDDECLAEGPCRATADEAIAAWNTRAYNPNERLREALEVARNAIHRLEEGGPPTPPHDLALIDAVLSPLPQGEDT